MKQILQAIFFSFVFAFAAYAETTVSATVDRTGLNPEDTLTLTVSVDSGEDVSTASPNLPAMNDFDVLNEWTSSSQQANMVYTQKGPQFKRVFSNKYNYLLQPKRQGTLSIGAVNVVVDGRSYNTKPISIKVAPGAGVNQRPQAGAPRPGMKQMPPGFGGAFPPPGLGDDDEDDLFSQLLKRQQEQPQGGSRTLPINPNEAFFVQVDTDKKEAYVGEQITVSFFLYTRGMIRDLDTLKYPSLRGFWKEDIDIATHLNFENEVVNGIPYKKALLASFALFPIKEGSATIDPYQAKCTVMAGLDAFSGFGLGKAYTYTKSSMPLKIEVKAVPAAGRPADYSGAVGEFQVTSRVEDRNIVEGQPFTYKVRFEGRGNAKLIDLPPLTVPEGIEQFDVQNEARFYKTGTSFKEFRVMLMPRRQGEFTIPAIGVSVFDPKSKSYVHKTTEPVTVRVGAGQTGKTAGLGLSDPAAVAKEAAAQLAAQEPKLIIDYKSPARLSSVQQTVSWIFVFLAIAATLVWRAKSELGWGQKKKDLVRALNVRMQRIHASVDKNDWRSVGTEMTNALYFVLGEISGEGGANLELDKLLLKAPPSVRRELADPLRKQMETFEVLTFAPEAVMQSAMQDPAKIRKAIADMEKLMTKAVSLGLSSEHDGESEPGPKAS